MKRFCLKCQKRLSKGRNLICTNCLVKENEAQKENIKKEKEMKNQIEEEPFSTDEEIEEFEKDIPKKKKK